MRSTTVWTAPICTFGLEPFGLLPFYVKPIHHSKNDPYLATEVKKIFSRNFVVCATEYGPYLKLWSRHIMLYVIYPEPWIILNKSGNFEGISCNSDISKIFHIFSKFWKNTRYILISWKWYMTLGAVYKIEIIFEAYLSFVFDGTQNMLPFCLTFIRRWFLRRSQYLQHYTQLTWKVLPN